MSQDSSTDPHVQAGWGYPSHGESRWPASVAILLAAALYVVLPDKLTPAHWVVPALELVLLVALMIANPSRLTRESRDMRVVSMALIGLVNAANVTSLVLLIRRLLQGGNPDGRQLIRAAVGVWFTLVIVFGLWYWELDRGGPIARSSPEHGPPDLLFPQMATPEVTGGRPWVPSFVDYMYVSLTNSTAFSPTDTMPLTARMKLLMSAQSLASLATIAVVGARAVNILK